MPTVAAHYLKILPKIEGESYGHKPIGGSIQHENEIDVKGWDWQASNQPAPTDSTTTDNAGKSGAASADKQSSVEVGTFTFKKSVDKSTTRLMQAMHKGEALELATFVLLEEIVDVHNERGGAFRLHVVLEKPIVVGYSLTADADEFAVSLEESWELSFSKITFAYESAGVFVTLDRPPASTQRRKKGPGKNDQADKRQLEGLLRQYGIEPDRKRRVKRG